MIAIFGGSFDPLHFGHLKNANLVQSLFAFEKFIFLPCGNPPHKEKLLFSQKQRLEMLNLTLKNYNELQVSDFELNNKISYTDNTLKHFKQKYNKICFVLGSDSFLDLPNWDYHHSFNKITNILVIGRGDTINNTGDFKQTTDIVDFKNSVGKVYFVKNELINISSTDIRSKIHSLTNLKHLVPQEIINYINEKTTIRTN